MKLIIAGSRDYHPSLEEINTAIAEMAITPTEVVCGEARGADTAGRKWAEAKGLRVESFPANWNQYGRAAGMRRNVDMAKYGDALLVFIKNNSPGSINMVNCMSRYPSKKCHIVFVT